MPESASAAASTGLQLQGGSVTNSSGNVYVVALVVLAVMLFIAFRKKGGHR